MMVQIRSSWHYLRGDLVVFNIKNRLNQYDNLPIIYQITNDNTFESNLVHQREKFVQLISTVSDTFIERSISLPYSVPVMNGFNMIS